MRGYIGGGVGPGELAVKARNSLWDRAESWGPAGLKGRTGVLRCGEGEGGHVGWRHRVQHLGDGNAVHVRQHLKRRGPSCLEGFQACPCDDPPQSTNCSGLEIKLSSTRGGACRVGHTFVPSEPCADCLMHRTMRRCAGIWGFVGPAQLEGGKRHLRVQHHRVVELGVVHGGPAAIAEAPFTSERGGLLRHWPNKQCGAHRAVHAAQRISETTKQEMMPRREVSSAGSELPWWLTLRRTAAGAARTAPRQGS